MKRLYKSLAIVSCLAGLGVGRVLSDSADTPEQAAARRALEDRSTVRHTEPPQAAVDAYQKIGAAQAASQVAPPARTEPPVAAVEAYNRKTAEVDEQSKAAAALARENQTKSAAAMNDLKSKLDAEEQAKVAEAKKAQEPPPAPPPPPPTREQKLANLLADYRADKLTPHQYQEQRAQLLAAPDK